MGFKVENPVAVNQRTNNDLITLTVHMYGVQNIAM